MPATDADIPKRTHYRTDEQAGLATSLSVLPESVDRRLDKPAPKIGVFLEVPTACLGARKAKPYQHVVVDEAQDLHEAQWRLLRPQVAVVTNVEWDHVDCYPNPESYRQAFITCHSLTRT